jgi:TonB family protein
MPALKCIFLALALLAQCLPGICQSTIEVSYFKDASQSKPVHSRDKAKYEEIRTKSEDNVMTIEFKRIRDGQLLSYRAYRNNVPLGVWKKYKKDGYYLIANYDFELHYSKEKVESAVYFDFATGKVVTSDSENSVAPKFTGAAYNVQVMLYSNIRYPENARKRGVQGDVQVQIKVDVEGKLTVVSIFEGVDGSLDKEAARALLECQTWEAAKMDGQNVDAYSIVKVRFRLD